VLPAMQKQGPVVAWIVDDTGFVEHSGDVDGGFQRDVDSLFRG
jgi:hypothetical protein